MTTHNSIGPRGAVTHELTRNLGELQQVGLWYHLRNWLQHRRRDVPRMVASRLVGGISGMLRIESALIGVTYRRPFLLEPWQRHRIDTLLGNGFAAAEIPRYFGGTAIEYGVLGRRVVTNAGVGYIVDAFQNLVELENMKFHGFGTGGTAEAAGDSALVTELTTQYNPDSTRPTGTTAENAANIYETVATLSPDAGGTIAITEHGIFSAASAGVLLDRTLFSAVNLVAGTDSLQTTYRLTLTSGS